ncbi:MAG: hypothetical protein IPM54_13780 [Polyangiaceae bacterium]|nr:hypothetical protein [Polyangiaceae bacterium]
MDHLSLGNDGGGRALFWIAFVVSAALAAAAVRFSLHEPLIAAALLALAGAAAFSRWWSRRRLRRVMRSGNVIAVLQSWSTALEKIPYPATMAPLMTATAFAAHGWVESARAALAAAERGPAWEAALEHRLFLDTILLALEGDRDAALEQARRLARMPLPVKNDALRDRILGIRVAVGAFARAFAHQSEPGDGELLERASERSPLVFWAMRYAAAIVAIDRGQHAKVPTLLEGAPHWPEESIFRAFHSEITDHARLESSASMN